MSKYMLIMRQTDETNAAFESSGVSFEQVIEMMGKYNQSMVDAGVLLQAEGLDDAKNGVVVDYSTETPTVTDGPYGETKELFNGFWILDVSTAEEAVEWAKRCPLGPGSKLEVRRVSEIEDFPQDNEWIRKEVGWRAEQAERLAEEARRAAAKA